MCNICVLNCGVLSSGIVANGFVLGKTNLMLLEIVGLVRRKMNEESCVVQE